MLKSLAFAVALLGAAAVGFLGATELKGHAAHGGGNDLRPASLTLASFSFGVQTDGATAREAQAANAEHMTRVIDALRRLGLAKGDIQTQDVSVSPKWNNDGSVTGPLPGQNPWLITSCEYDSRVTASAPGRSGARRPEKRVTARSKLPQNKCTGLHLPMNSQRKRSSTGFMASIMRQNVWATRGS